MLHAEAQINSDVRRNVVSRGGMSGGVPSNTYMQITDMDGRKVVGNSEGKDKKDLISITHFAQKSALDTEAETATVNHGPVRITKMADESSAILMEMLDTGQKLKRVDILIFDKDKDGGESETYRLRLEGVSIVSINSQLSAASARMGGATRVKEDIHLAYERISWTIDNGISSYHTDIE